MCDYCCSDPGCHTAVFVPILGPAMVDLEWAIAAAQLELIPCLRSEKSSLQEKLRRWKVSFRCDGWKKRYEQIKKLGYPQQEKPAQALADQIWKTLGQPVTAR